MKTQRHQNESGIALILTLTILAVVLILLLAFMTSMRTERIAAKAFNDQSKAKAFAEGAVDEALALLQSSMTNITVNSSYITAPGVVYTWSAGAWNPTFLYTSGSGVSFGNSILGTYSPTTPIQVGWQRVFSTGVNPELVGRFAYWIDDESTKVNLNTAQLRANDPAGYTPAAIDLLQLFQGAGDPSPAVEANAIINYTTSTRPLDTIESIKLTQPVIANAPSISANSFSNSEFFVTANATSPDLTPWGTKRLNLTSLLGQNPTKAQKIAAVGTITTALSDTNLALWYGGVQTFATKYNLQPTEIQQIAANIVDYITKDNIPTDSSAATPSWNDMTAPAFLGLKQTPYLNELVISNTFVLTTDPILATTDGTLTINSTVTAELWYMYTNSAGWTAPLGTSVLVGGIPNITLNGGVVSAFAPGGGTATISPVTSIPAGPGTIAGTYVTVVVPLPTTTILVPDTSVPIHATLNPGTITALLTSPLGGRMDYAQIPMGPALLNQTLGSVTVASPTLSLVWQSQCNDPRVKPISNTWRQIRNLQLNTLGLANSPLDMAGGNGTGTIPGDNGATPGVDISCHVVSTPTRQRGTMLPSELAYIHTGIPWRTFYLEPQPAAESGLVPDWLAVDLFSATDITNVAGRVNINVLNGDAASAPRILPLIALLGGSPLIANNIYNYTLDPPPPPTVPAFVPAADKYFTTAGQVCEVTGLADVPGPSKSVREALAQSIVNLVTPRSDTFTIWAMAQGIKKVQPPLKNFIPGTDLITGEVAIQAIVQRYEDPSTFPATVRFRTLYYRYIYQ
jgi:hypothetical protein